MKTKKTIITLLVLVLVWFLLSNYMQKTETANKTSQEQNVSENATGEDTYTDTPDDVAAELEMTIAEEESLDSELDELETLSFE